MDMRSDWQSMFPPKVHDILMWRDKKRHAFGIALIVNLFFVLVCFLGYSAFALILLFLFFISSIGLGLHLFYNATSDDETGYSNNVNISHPDVADAQTVQKAIMHNTEFVSMQTSLNIYLFFYEAYLRLLKFHNDIITIKSPEQTLCALAALPLAFIVSWVFNVSMIVWIWLCCNFLLFLPKLIKSSPQARARADKIY